jgi:hypothetical protein
MTARRYKGNEVDTAQEFEVQFVFSESPAVNILTVIFIDDADKAGVFGSVIAEAAATHVSNVSPWLYDICLEADEIIISGELYEREAAA